MLKEKTLLALLLIKTLLKILKNVNNFIILYSQADIHEKLALEKSQQKQKYRRLRIFQEDHYTKLS